MRVEFDENGNFVKATGSSIFKQSNDTNELILVMPFAKGEDVASVSATFLLPYGKNSGQYGQYCPTSLVMARVEDATDGVVWYNTISDGYLNNSGNAKLSARVVYSNRNIKTSEQVQFTIEPSGDYVATAIPDDIATQLDNKINILARDKQDKRDTSLNPTFAKPDVDYRVVKAINFLDNILNNPENGLSREVEDILTYINGELKNTLADHNTRIGNNEDAITSLQTMAFSGLDRIGTLIKDTSPIPFTEDIKAELTAFVQQEVSREPKNGDYIEWKNTTNNTAYRIYFGNGSWQEPDQVEDIVNATNSLYGLIKGNKGTADKLVVDIVNGIIKDILVRDKGSYTSIDTLIKDNIAKLENIVSGQQIVGKADKSNTANHSITSDKANKSIGDGNGANIVDTYAKKNDVYTKDEADDAFLPIDYSYIYYYSKSGIVDVVPTDVTPQFDVAVASVGATTIFDIDRILANKYTFNKNTTDNSQIWVSTDRPCAVKFRLTTTGVRGGERKVLAVDTTGTLNFDANSPRTINFKTIYNQLESEYNLFVGDVLEKKLEVITDFSEATQVKVFSNETYPSTFNLVAKSITLNINELSGKKIYNINHADWIANGEGEYYVTLSAKKLDIAPTNQYGMDLQYWNGSAWQRVLFTPTIYDNGNITIVTSKPRDYELLVWIAMDIDKINEGGTRMLVNGVFVPEINLPDNLPDMLEAIELGNVKDGVEFDIEPTLVEDMFKSYDKDIHLQWSNWLVTLRRHDRKDGGNKVYYSATMELEGTKYLYTLTIDKSTNKGLLERVAEADKNTASAMANRLKFNQLFDTETSTLPSANGLVVTNIYGGHHVVGTTDHQYYHKMYDIATISGHWYYFAPNFSDTKSVYILGHIDGTAFSTNKGKVFEGGAKFDAYIQIEKDKTMDFDVQPILVDLTEMFGEGNEPTAEDEVYKYFAKDTYYPYIDNVSKKYVENLFIQFNPERNRIYGVNGIGGSSPTLTRTDSSVGKSYVKGETEITSDFSLCYPYSEIKEVTDDYGNVFVKIPKFYTRVIDNGNGTYKHLMSGARHLGFSTLFVDGKGNEIDYVLVGKYEASGTTSRMYSKSGEACLVNINIVQARAAAKANGAGYQQYDFLIDAIIKELFMIEFATTNTQSIMRGYVDANSAAVRTGRCDALATPSGSELSNTSGKSACKYRGIENPFGNVWKWVDGINFRNEEIWLCLDPTQYASDKFASPYEQVGARYTAEGWAKAVKPFEKYPLLGFTTTVGGSESTYFSDYYYYASGNRVLRVGGNWTNGSNAGLWCWLGSDVSSLALSHLGCRLCYKPL